MTPSTATLDECRDWLAIYARKYECSPGSEWWDPPDTLDAIAALWPKGWDWEKTLGEWTATGMDANWNYKEVTLPKTGHER